MNQDIQNMPARLFNALFHLILRSWACGWVVRTVIVLASRKRSLLSAAGDVADTRVLAG